MTAKTSQEKIKETFKLYESGLSFNEISKILKMHPSTLQRLYRENGGVARKTSQGRLAHNTITSLPEKSICDEYLSGDSENAISKKYSVSRNVISRILRRNGIDRRSQSESELIKWSRMSSEQRANQVAKCHAAMIGFKKSEEQKHNLAISRQKNPAKHHIGVGESVLKKMLESDGFEFEYQKPVLGYNLDFFIHGVAVELTSFTGRNSVKKMPQKERAFNIFNASGIHTMAVEITSDQDIVSFYNHILCAASDLSNCNDSHCNYWIARCKGSKFTLEKIVVKTLQ